MIFLRQMLKIAAYDTTRVALVNGSNDKFATQAAKQILNGRGVKDFNVSVTPSNFCAAAYGTPITFQVRAKANSNSAFFCRLLQRHPNVHHCRCHRADAPFLQRYYLWPIGKRAKQWKTCIYPRR